MDCTQIVEARMSTTGSVTLAEVCNANHYWRLHETSGLTFADYIGTSNAVIGSASGVTYGVDFDTPDGSAGLSLDGTQQNAIFSSVTLGAGHSVSFWLKPNSANVFIGTSNKVIIASSGTDGVYYDASNKKISFFTGGTDHRNTTALVDGQIYHIVITISVGGSGKFYVNGVLDGTFTFGSSLSYVWLFNTTLGTSALKCDWIRDIGLYTRELTATEAKLKYQTGYWVDISSDLIAEEKLTADRGINENGPTGHVASSGTCRFTLNNMITNSGGIQGWYSPPHPSVRLGWGHGTLIRLTYQFIINYAQRVLADGAGGFWRLAEAVGATLVSDETYYEANGTPNNVTFGVTGPMSDGATGASFNGSSSYITIPDRTYQNPRTGSYSYEVWVKRAAGIAASEFILAKAAGGGGTGGGGELFISAAGTFVSRLGAKQVNSASGFADGNWHHVVIVINRAISNGGQFYVDGIASGTAIDLTSESAIDLSGNNEVLTIGRRPTGNYFNGSLADVAVFNFALSAAQVSALYAKRTSTISTSTYLNRKFYGRVNSINVITGKYRQKRVQVEAGDWMKDAEDTDVRTIVPQINVTELNLVTAVLGALPEDAQPYKTSYDTALDVYPYAFDTTIGAGAKAAGLLQETMLNALGYLFVKGDGTLQYINRQTHVEQDSVVTFDNSMHGMEIPTTLDQIYNKVRLTWHPRKVDATASTVLYAIDASVEVLPASTLELWGTYNDPTNPDRLIGGTAQIAPVATTDYLANTVSDGSGTNVTGSVTVTADFFATTVKFTLTNPTSASAFFTFLQVRGKGIYDLAPLTLEYGTEKGFGDRFLDLDFPLQSTPQLLSSYAKYLYTIYSSITNQGNSVFFITANANTDPLLTQYLTRQLGDKITLIEDMTFPSPGVEFFIQHESTEVLEGVAINFTWTLAPTLAQTAFWTLEVVGLSELETTTFLGYF